MALFSGKFVYRGYFCLCMTDPKRIRITIWTGSNNSKYVGVVWQHKNDDWKTLSQRARNKIDAILDNRKGLA